MRLIKYTHACVRLEHDGRALVIDPGTWSEPAALDGATAVLVTHEHFDR
jgi:L-ascorbate metabolism protein UlaG (beta-lactamase superfamily)